MSEVAFAKSFLATLDKRPIKLAADHVSDPRKYPNQSPYTLPKQSHPYPRQTGPTSTQQAQAHTITAVLKPMRSGEPITLTGVTLDTAILDLKTRFAEQTGQPPDKVKLLLNKKPTADLKTLKELGVDGDVELSVMIMAGGSASTATAAAVSEKAGPVPDANQMEVDEKMPAPESEKAQAEAEAERVATGTESVAQTLRSEEFWTDLKGFLSQRLRDERASESLAKTFRDAWSRP